MCYLFRYKCINKEDGIAVKKDDNNNDDDDNGTMEGSDSRDQSYECNGDGEYTVPIDTLSGLPKFPSCIPRSKPCCIVLPYQRLVWNSIAAVAFFKTFHV